MGFEIRKESYTGTIKEVTIGKGNSALTVGGETCYPFYTFEGTITNKPVIAMEIWDMEPEDWPQSALAPFKDVISDPAAWAKKCVEQYDAELIVLQLKSIDPNDQDASPESAAETVKRVQEAIDVPLIIWGSAAPDKDEEVFKVVAEKCQDGNLIMGPVEEKNFKGIAAAAMGYNHSLIASSPIDVNLAKQVNILLENFGMPMDRVIVDPTTGGLGYGMEYSYSVMERLTMAAMTQGDDKLQYPMINNLGNEIWKCKEAKQDFEDAPQLGDPERRGILMEAVGAVAYLLCGSNILIMRHPESIRLAKGFINAMTHGDSVMDIDPISKLLTGVEYTLADYATEPDLTIKEEKVEKKASVKAEEPKTKPVPQQEKKTAPAKEQKAKAKQPILKPPPNKSGRLSTQLETVPEITPEQQTLLDAQLKIAAEQQLKDEVLRQEQQAEQTKLQAEKDEKARVEAEKMSARVARLAREEEELALQAKRMENQHQTQHPEQVTATKKLTAAAEQKSETDKILEHLNRFHKRV